MVFLCSYYSLIDYSADINILVQQQPYKFLWLWVVVTLIFLTRVEVTVHTLKYDIHTKLPLESY